ncbi:MAG: alkene reductase [Herminiimonas sp.]|nr:alkene reductase [Herminiimonas sp.]
MTSSLSSPNDIDAKAAQSDLFAPMQLGPLTLANRIVMAPLTRSRAGAADVPSEMAIEYYVQRASAGLIIAEATQVSPQGKGYVYTPGIYSADQVQAWKKITDAVHAAGGRIFLQLWHVGRISHPSLQPDGALPVAPSAIKPEGQAFTEAGFVPLETPRALATSEMPDIVQQYRTGAENALAAGFDGVEIHAANGYLLDQFLRDKTNRRTDAYGGTIENRARLLMEVTAAVVKVWGGDRVGIRLSPLSTFGDIADSNPQALFSYVVEQLNAFGLVYLHVIEGDTGGARQLPGGFDPQILRRLFKGAYMANNGYDRQMALDARATDSAELIAFGRPYIGNPDLVARLRINAPLVQPDPATMYGGGAEGYIDYPAIQA